MCSAFGVPVISQLPDPNRAGGGPTQFSDARRSARRAASTPSQGPPIGNLTAILFRPERAHRVDGGGAKGRSEEHTSELQSPCNLVCRLLLEKKKKTKVPAMVRKQTSTIE